MSREMLLVLMLSTGVAVAEPQAQPQAQTPPQTQTETQTKPAVEQTAGQSAEQTAGQTQDAPAKTDEDGKLISVPGGKGLGISILGNQEAPTSLVIVPWKSSELGGALGISPMLDDSRQPIDKEVFMRMLSYYQIRSETARPVGAPAKGNEAQPANAADRRK